MLPPGPVPTVQLIEQPTRHENQIAVDAILNLKKGGERVLAGASETSSQRVVGKFKGGAGSTCDPTKPSIKCPTVKVRFLVGQNWQGVLIRYGVGRQRMEQGQTADCTLGWCITCAVRTTD